jgi:PAS domain S-box-containing protein
MKISETTPSIIPLKVILALFTLIAIPALSVSTFVVVTLTGVPQYFFIHLRHAADLAGIVPDTAAILKDINLFALPLLAILLVILLWSRSLRRQVALKTRELRRNEEFLRAMIACSPVALYSIDLDGRLLTWNASSERIFGWTADEVIGHPLPTVPEDKHEEFDHLLERLGSGQAFEGMEVVRMKKDGTRFDGSISAAPIRGVDGTIIGILVATADITERKHAQQRIENLNHVLRAIRDVNQLIVHEREPDILIREGSRLIVDNRGYASALIVLTDENDRPTSWGMAGMAASSPLLIKMLDSGELPGCCRFAPATMEVALIEGTHNVCRNCGLMDATVCAEKQVLCVRLVHEDIAFGYLAAVPEYNLKLDDEELSLFTEMASDLAYALNTLRMEEARKKAEIKRKSLEDQLLQAQKLESVGRLAGGVAHDFNNMLSVIVGHAELVLEQMQTDDPLRPHITEVHAAARRSADITRQLLAFARRQTAAPKLLDLNITVESALKMLRRLIGEDIDLSWNPKQDLWPVKMDPTQIDQILANLCVNARDAISDVGKITIETGKAIFDTAYCAEHAGFQPGEYVLLAVSDNGSGMDKETRDKIFEPFFTTKGVGRGTGLGLSTVYGIVRQNDGFINVYSEPGKGSTFKIYLPRHTGQIVAEPIAGEAEFSKGNGELILIVEDDASILQLTEKMLTSLNYRVLVAGSPPEALRLAQSCTEKIILLITDVVMPEMNGRELADHLRSHDPDLRCLFMSGYTADVIAHRGILEAGVNFIQKPFSKKELANKVRAALSPTV